MTNRYIAVCLLTASVFPTVAYSHHGLDFISVQTVHLPQQGAAYAIGRVDYISEEEYEVEFEPAVLFGATDWMAIEIHAHYEKEQGGSTKYESIAPALQIRLTPRDQQFSLGLSVEYEFAGESDEDDVVGLTAILGYEFSAWTVATNLRHEKAANAPGEWDYAVGVRRSFRHDHGFGLELNGSLESDGSSGILAGYYGELSERFSINAGIGTGLDGGPDWSLRSAFIWQFK